MSSPPPPEAEAAPACSQESKGGWIGIDLGTSNCAAAVWDLSRSRCKVLGLGHKNLARPPPEGKARKGGKIVPSAILFSDELSGDPVSEQSSRGDNGLSSLVGYAAIEESSTDTNDGDETGETGRSQALVTSFKRVVGMSSRQAEELKSSDPEFWNSLPFQPVILDTDKEHSHREDLGSPGHFLDDALGDDALDPARVQSSNQSRARDVKEGVAISVRPLEEHPSGIKPHEQIVTPLQLSTILLQSIRVAASEFLASSSKNIQPPGYHDETQVNNCIIGVPVHYSQAQRNAIQNAAKSAGFAGYVGVMTESTAAVMAYGLFVSPNIAPASASHLPRNGDKGKNILVFDMGGGTTDVTIACIDFGDAGNVQFRVIATAGDRCLGGDNVDELLARYLWKRREPSLGSTVEGLDWKASNQQEFVSKCRRAKEELCGNDDDGQSAEICEAHIDISGKTIRITRQEFDSAIQSLIDRAERVVDDALSSFESDHKSRQIHEVVLVGGSTRIPAIRQMLRRKFPPPIPPELCTSIPAETAVAQGLAIQAALVSGSVPLWELRNAMMLDVLPHSIGVWVADAGSNGDVTGESSPLTKGQIIQPNKNVKHRGHFVPILNKDDPLPATGCATFTLAAKDQSGVTVSAVENIGPGCVYQCMGVFDFLLHRMDSGDCNGSRARELEIGMTLETSGKFIVSIFDESDPEHREKKRRYLKYKALHDGNKDDIREEDIGNFYDKDEERPVCTGTEICLIFLCIILFSLYVGARVAFGEIDMNINDEL
ncbi:hypothetical protein ACHAWF_015562 [Thalassiosira exigua]